MTQGYGYGGIHKPDETLLLEGYSTWLYLLFYESSDSWIGYVLDPGIAWRPLQDGIDEFAWFDTPEDAVAFATPIAKEIAAADAPAIDWRRGDLASQLRDFRASHPNRADYVRLFWDNDPNGSFDNLLSAPIEESEDLFEEMFGEELRAAEFRPNAGYLEKDYYTVFKDRLGNARWELVLMPDASSVVSTRTYFSLDHAADAARAHARRTGRSPRVMLDAPGGLSVYAGTALREKPRRRRRR